MLFFNVLLFAFFILIQIENILFFSNEIALLFGDKTFSFSFFFNLGRLPPCPTLRYSYLTV